ncbi:N-acetylglucosamine-6-phosphate deacetylase [Suttonella sp. R2A3]|uniref:N-acetylglucosamine-6-phosphate deacetylase n=1 Tax=Suttonella sp. R2A3 TaxID=2908648 RepID=UPI001F457F52|nr:N-acetylglucosamine-6-phosphate deacetylase [Suttonella sp. R2A3]UJF24054.1 N-acetylglucosamine-6-phosphate deacetylase [Suttonella sp. R2A3]
MTASEDTMQYYLPNQLFDRGRLLEDRVLAVKDGVSQAIIPRAQLDDACEVISVNGTLSPGFVETQANGGGGVLFNDSPDRQGIETMLAAHRQYGTVAMLPTFITDTPERYHQAIAAIAEGVEAGIPGLIGGHFEGPFLHPEKKGTHQQRFFRTPDDADFACFAEHQSALQHSIISLAPERLPAGTVKRFHELGLHINMAHSMATHDDLIAANSEGLTGITHLYNAMRPMQGRDPGPIGSAVSLDLYAGIIADGVHSHPFALRSAYQLLGAERLMLVTDSMHTIGTDIKEFMLTGQKVFVREDRLVNEAGSLAGAHVTLLRCLHNAIRYMHADLESALKMAVSTPANYLGRADLASISHRRCADIICLDDQLALKDWYQ